MLKGHRGHARGAAMVEFHIVALFALVPMCLGIIQMALLMVENHHIDHAAFMAVRHGAVTHGDLAEVRKGFARIITTLHVDASAPLDRGNAVARVAAAYARATRDIALYARFTLLAPDSAAQADFATLRNGQRVIPNDSLEYRSAIAGPRSGLSLQAANVLRVQISYCRPLIVPFVRELLLASLSRMDTDLWNQRCYAAGRVPIRSEGIAPMQSDFRVSS